MTLRIRTRTNAFDIASTMAAHGYIVMIENKGTHYLLTIQEVGK